MALAELKICQLFGLKWVELSEGEQPGTSFLVHQGQQIARPTSPTHILAALKKLDDLHLESGVWTKLTWDIIAASAAQSILLPQTIMQGRTTTNCGPICILEQLAQLCPDHYVDLVAECFSTGRIITRNGSVWQPIASVACCNDLFGLCSDGVWGGKKGGWKASDSILASDPAKTVPEHSQADWMVASAIISIRNEVDEFRDLLGHDDYKGQEGYAIKGFDVGPMTADYAAGLSAPWEEAQMMSNLIPRVMLVERRQIYMSGDVAVLRDLASQRQRLIAGEFMAVLLVSAEKLAGEGLVGLPNHWVTLHDIEYPYEGDQEQIQIKMFSRGMIETYKLDVKGFSEAIFEAITADIKLRE